MDVLNFKEILVKRPFFQISAERSALDSIPVTDKNNAIDRETDKASYYVLTQEEMLRQYFPSGHKINNTTLFPDIYKQDPETKRWYIQPITRCALGFQQIIATKHTIHIVGNDVQFELTAEEQKSQRKRVEQMNIDNPEEIFEIEDDEASKLLSLFKKGWSETNMEIHFFEAVRSYMITGEGAIVGAFTKDGTPVFKSLSFLNDEKLYPHFDSITGELNLFARKYYDYDEDGNALTEWVEVWDETYLYRCRHGLQSNGIVTKIKDLFGLNGFEVVDKVKHGYNTVPVAYVRNNEGPCWSPAQDTIEKFEEAMSYFFENNKAFAFPILVVSGEGVELQGDMNGSVKSIAIDDKDGDAHFLDNNDVSASYNTLLSKFYDLIYEQSFTVKPPELKSGDLPGVALKLLYSPAIECAIEDAQKLQPFVDKLVKMVKYSWGLKEDCQSDLVKLGINTWIEPYVHQNDTELITNLATAVQNNFLSCKTASERNTKYGKNDEYERIVRELKDKMLLDVQKDNLKTEHKTDENIRQKKAEASIGKGQDINTGGGQGNEHINETDENGNHPNENNWEEFNQRRF